MSEFSERLDAIEARKFWGGAWVPPAALTDIEWLLRVARNTQWQVDYLCTEIAVALGQDPSTPSEIVHSVRDLFAYAGNRDATIARVRELHVPSSGDETDTDDNCDHDGFSWPCQTRRALDGEVSS